MARTAKISRKTRETDISLELNLDGKGDSKIKTTIGFLDHMFEALAKHASFDLKISATGDSEKVDQHHLVEDLGIVFGEAVGKCLRNKTGIMRAGSDGAFAFPMDEALALAAVDFANRTRLTFKIKFREKEVGELKTNVIEDFFEGFRERRAREYLSRNKKFPFDAPPN